MKKTKKALLAALACSVVLAGGVGLAACKGGGDEGHTHDWGNGWTVSQNPSNGGTGLATRTCGKSGCDATTEDTQLVLPALDGEDADAVYSHVTKTEANCSTDGVLTYTYEKDGNHVEFDVNIGKDADNHAFKVVNDGEEGHHTECANNSEHNTAVVGHDTENGGACSVCGNVDLDAAITVTGATANAPKRYTVKLAAGDYQIVIDDAVVDTGLTIAIGTLNGNNLTEIDSEGYDKLIKVTTAGVYTVEVYSNVTFKVRTAVLHTVHEFDENSWESNKTHHWHPAICGCEDQKSGEATHTLGAESEADEDGVTHQTCSDCGYVKYNYGTALDSTNPTINVTETGNYTTTIVADDYDYGGGVYSVLSQQYTLTNNGSDAKKYTVKVLTENTSVTPGWQSGISAVSEKGAKVSFVLEAGESLSLTLGTNTTMVNDVNFALDVAFRVIVEEAPAVGDILRPVSVNDNGEFGVTGVTAGDKVYFKVTGNYGETFNSKNVQLTFGEGVTVYKLGANINNEEPEAIDSEDYITFDWSNTTCYFYAQSTGTDCKVSFNVFVAPGEKENPIVAKIDGTENAVDLTSQFQMWYKLDGLTAGTKYIVKTTAAGSNLSLYSDLAATSPALTAEGGAALVFTPVAATVYISASGYGEYKFTVGVFGADDKGFAASDPVELADEAELEVKPGTFYYAITPTVSADALLKYESEDTSIYFYRYSDEDFSEHAGFGSNQMTFFMQANQTYYVKVVNESGATGNFNFTFEEYVAHDYTITVSDGTNTYNDVTVTLYYIEYEEDEDGDYKAVKHEVDIAATNNNDGTYTFGNVDTSKNYYVKVTGLPATHDYYEDELYIAKNFDEATTGTVNVYERQTYKVKVALPEGVELPAGASLANLKVTLTQSMSAHSYGEDGEEETSAFTVLTDAEGLAEFSVLDPVSFRGGAKNDSSYNVIVEVPATHALYGQFAYIAQTSGGVTVHKTVRKTNRDITAEPVALTVVKAYTVSLKLNGNNLEEGTKVTLNDEEYEIGANGTFNVILVPGKTPVIKIKGYDVATPAVNEETNTISATVTVNESIISVGQTVTVNLGNNLYKEYEIELEEGKTYALMIDGVSSYDAMDIMIGSGKFQGELDGIVYGDYATNNFTVFESGKYYLWIYYNATFEIVEVES